MLRFPHAIVAILQPSNHTPPYCVDLRDLSCIAEPEAHGHRFTYDAYRKCYFLINIAYKGAVLRASSSYPRWPASNTAGGCILARTAAEEWESRSIAGDEAAKPLGISMERTDQGVASVK